MAVCQATPLDGHGHTGTVRAHVRICPQGHHRTGDICDGCAGNGATRCGNCPDEGPAILIRRDRWDSLIATIMAGGV
jgi:hypothetical protein